MLTADMVVVGIDIPSLSVYVDVVVSWRRDVDG